MVLKPKLKALFVEYADCHRHPTNRLTHKIAIPLIVFHIIAMLSWIPLFALGGFQVTAAHVAYLAAIGWYLTLHVRLGVTMALLFAICFPLAAVTPWPAVVAIAVIGWLVQLAGHAVWEKQSPAFLRNLLQALVGPLFFVASLTGDWKQRGGGARLASR
ncbi:MAG TPA: Mpo1-like protein [Vulgatibacter sp.]